jgi:5-hydroxyisourate hydrolase-like protein (transthyretin family)
MKLSNVLITNRSILSGSTLIVFSLLLLMSPFIYTSGNGRAAAFDGEKGIATEGDSFCNIVDDIAEGKFSPLFEGIVGDCDHKEKSFRTASQFFVEYSYSKNPVKIGENTYLMITVKDKETGNPVSNAFVKLAIGPASQSQFDSGAFSIALSTAVAAAVAGEDVPIMSSSVEGDKKTSQTMYTDSKGRATFTVQLGSNSDTGTYDTEVEVSKASYQSGFKQTDLHVI